MAAPDAGAGTPHRDPHARYRGRAAALDTEAASLEARSRRLTLFRTLAFLASFAAWVAADLLDVVLTGRIVAGVIFVLFLVLVGRHRRLRKRIRRVQAAKKWVRRGQARLDRRWEDLPAPRASRDLSDHPYAVDLDLFGPASLASLLEPVRTPPGRATLESWLLGPADPEEIGERQEAVRELAEDWTQREAFAVEGSLLEESAGGAPAGRTGLDDFLSWCRETNELPRWLVVSAWVLPLLTASLLVGHLAGALAARWWVGLLLVQAVIGLRRGRQLHGQFSLASTGLPGLRRYHTLLACWEEYPARAPLLVRQVDRLGHGPSSSSRALRELEQLLHLADLRLSTLYIVFAVGFLWDVHVVRGLLRWRTRHGEHVEGWMEAMGRLEALSSLATLVADHPSWTFPEVERPGREPRFRARGLGHPLLHPAECVRNDVVVGPPGTVLLVTGSNMSGKSTLLRAIGVAAVLADAGGPVCAEDVSLPAVRLFTSMRVQDSLEAGVSFFMAELLRLKALLEEAPPRHPRRDESDGAEDTPSEPPLLYLVDEVLQGTNSEERRQAGRRLIRHLLRRRALGVVTTHDLELHRDPEVEPAAVLVHFRESLDAAGGGLEFDYRLREGLATTRNALRLAERVGLTDPDEESGSGPTGSQRTTP